MASIWVAIKANQIAERQTDYARDQNKQAEIQNALLEAQRFATLSGELSELCRRIRLCNSKLPTETTEERRNLIPEIQALSRLFLPYRVLVDTGINRELSPRPYSRERATLLLACMSAWPKSRGQTSGTPSYAGADFTYSDLRNLDFLISNVTGFKLSYADFSFSRITGISSEWTELNHADFSHAQIYPHDYDENGMMERPINPTFSNSSAVAANFSVAKLDSVSFDNAVLVNGKFNSAWLRTCSFRESILTDATFSDANLRGVDFSGAYLPMAGDFDGAIFGDDILLEDARVEQSDWLIVLDRVAKTTGLADKWSVEHCPPIEHPKIGRAGEWIIKKR